jgi:hypothetical protein
MAAEKLGIEPEAMIAWGFQDGNLYQRRDIVSVGAAAGCGKARALREEQQFTQPVKCRELAPAIIIEAASCGF